MNVLFLYSEVIDPLKGGVEKVTSILADFLEEKGFGVFYLCLHKSSDNYHHRRQLFLPEESSFLNQKNKDTFKEILKSNKIGYVINQGALFPETFKFSLIANNEGVHVISVIHNSILSIIDNYNTIFINNNTIKGKIIRVCYRFHSFKRLIRYIYIHNKKSHYKMLLDKSSAVVLLSNQYINEISLISNKKDLHNVFAIPNPIKVDSLDFVKENKVLYVGRVNNGQKQVNRLMKIWRRIEPKHPDWSIDIVGDGEDLNMLKSKFKDLKSVNFCGFQNPSEFYKKSKIFCMTSSFEGLPMTLLEAQSFGVVPMAFNTFESASDIIEDKINGYLISPFDEDEYIKKLDHLIEDQNELMSMQSNAYAHSHKFDIEVIGERWISLFQMI